MRKPMIPSLESRLAAKVSSIIPALANGEPTVGMGSLYGNVRKLIEVSIIHHPSPSAQFVAAGWRVLHVALSSVCTIHSRCSNSTWGIFTFLNALMG